MLRLRMPDGRVEREPLLGGFQRPDRTGGLICPRVVTRREGKALACKLYRVGQGRALYAGVLEAAGARAFVEALPGDEYRYRNVRLRKMTAGGARGDGRSRSGLRLRPARGGRVGPSSARPNRRPRAGSPIHDKPIERQVGRPGLPPPVLAAEMPWQIAEPHAVDDGIRARPSGRRRTKQGGQSAGPRGRGYLGSGDGRRRASAPARPLSAPPLGRWARTCKCGASFAPELPISATARSTTAASPAATRAFPRRRSAIPTSISPRRRARWLPAGHARRSRTPACPAGRRLPAVGRRDATVSSSAVSPRPRPGPISS